MGSLQLFGIEIQFHIIAELRQKPVEILSRAVRTIDVAMTDNGSRTGIDMIDTTQGRYQFRQGFHLGISRDFFFKISGHIYADCMVIFPIRMGSHDGQGAPPFDDAVFTDNIMITDAGLAIGQMCPVDSGS